jgi:cobalt-zinc-cadmium efflux system membrane fusion protein
MNRVIVFYISAIIGFSSCGNQTPLEPEQTATAPSTTIQLSDEELQMVNVKTSTVERKNISVTIQASGFLDVPPNSKVTIAAPLQGFVKSTQMLQGTRVQKGDVLVVLQHQDYIQLQQDYLDFKSQLNYLEEENNRQEALSADNVNAKKTTQLAQSAYQSMKAKVSGTEAKLRLIGIEPHSLSNGVIQPTIQLKSPIAGYVTQVNVNAGSFVNPADIMFVVVNTEHLHAELTIFEKDIHRVKVGQKVLFTLGNETTQRSAQVYLIGREIKADRSVQIHCHLDKEDKNLIPGMFLKAHIETSNEMVKALPDAAIVRYEGKAYVFVEKAKGQYEQAEVATGSQENGYVELLEPVPFADDTKIVEEGSYSLLGKLKNTGE